MAYLGPACACFGCHSFSLERSSVPTQDSSNPEKNASRMAYLGPACACFGCHLFSLERSSVPTQDSSNPEKNASRN